MHIFFTHGTQVHSMLKLCHMYSILTAETYIADMGKPIGCMFVSLFLCSHVFY